MTPIGFKCRLIASIFLFSAGISLTIINVILLTKFISQKLCNDSYMSCFIDILIQDNFYGTLTGITFLLIGLVIIYLGYVLFPKK